MDDSQYLVRAGSSYHDKEGNLHNVTTIIAHYNYNTTTIDYDVSLIRIRPPLKLGTPKVDKINLVTKNNPVAPGTKSIVSGWGFYYMVRISTDYYTEKNYPAFIFFIFD